MIYVKSHLLSHTGEKSFKCALCEKTFIQLTHLIHHKLSHSGERSFKCDLVEKAFAQLVSLKTHN